MATLTVEEYQRILAVLKRDSALRKQEQDRINKLRSSLQSDSEDSGCPRCDSQHKCSSCINHRELRLQSGDWFYRQVQSRFCRNNNNNNTAGENGVAMDPESAQVREFIERLVEALVSGQLDDVKVNRLYSHPDYDRMFSCHHNALCETLVRLSFALQMAIANKPLPEHDSPTAVHTALKQRIQDIIQEAMTLPNLKSQVDSQKNNNTEHKWDDDITAMSYEDILATAILNKVIEQFQQLCDGNSNVLMRNKMGDKCNSDNGPNSLEDAEMSSQEGPRSWSESSHTEPLSMTIEECIEEEVTYDSEGEERQESRPTSELDFYLSGLNFIKQRRVPFPELGVDIVDGEQDEEAPQPTDVVSPVDSWEENWLFQRRRLKVGGSAQSPMPVPMLVPNPSEDFRALIGDRDAEEVSDLSDLSDRALEDVVLADEDTVDMADTELQEKHEVAELVKASSVECLSEFGQQDSEYTEDYASVTQRQLSSLTCDITEPTEPAEQVVPGPPVPKPRSLPPQNKTEDSGQDKSEELDLSQDKMEETDLAMPPRPGTIAEREHRKWQSAVPLPNNPYSPENISKRLSNRKPELLSYSAATTYPELREEPLLAAPLQVVCSSAEPDYKKYGRDYYINEARYSSGTRRSVPQAETEQDSGVDMSDTNPMSSHVGIEVARWQKGIDQTEEQWRSKISKPSSPTSRRKSNSTSPTSLKMPNGTTAIPKNTNSTSESAVNTSATKLSNATSATKLPHVLSKENGSAHITKPQTPSECSTVSSDLDFDADVPIVLPSVKELAKHFSGGATSDSDTSISKVTPTARRKPESQKKNAEPPRTNVSLEKREIHSLTARSISREFREGLRRNLPARMDRNLHSLQDSASSSPEPVNGNSTTPGYTSDESGTRSPTPPVRRLKSNIAFWEQLSGK